MSEEIKNATVVIPRSIVYGLIMNGTIGFGTVVATLFCIGDPTAILSTSFDYPFIAIFVQATQSVGGSAVMVALILLVGLGLNIGTMAAASRMLWSFARDRGVPGWRRISKVRTNLNRCFRSFYSSRYRSMIKQKFPSPPFSQQQFYQSSLVS